MDTYALVCQSSYIVYARSWQSVNISFYLCLCLLQICYTCVHTGLVQYGSAVVVICIISLCLRGIFLNLALISCDIHFKLYLSFVKNPVRFLMKICSMLIVCRCFSLWLASWCDIPDILLPPSPPLPYWPSTAPFHTRPSTTTKSLPS